MMYLKRYLQGSLNPSAVFDTLEYKAHFRKMHPEYFPLDGITVFCGPQGSGKTLSMVNFAWNVAKKFPKLVICTNVELHSFPHPERIVKFEGDESLSTVNNGYEGVLFLIDEIHVLYNSLESKNIDPSVMAQICQQRKQRKMIVGTSQVFSRIAKPFREQFRWAIVCRCAFGVLQLNTIVDGERSVSAGDGSVKAVTCGHSYWFHRPCNYLRYDTYAKIEKLDATQQLRHLLGVKKSV